MFRRHRSTPSFSSSLLDEIYHSIDEAERKDNNKGDNFPGLHMKDRKTVKCGIGSEPRVAKENMKKRTTMKSGIEFEPRVTKEKASNVKWRSSSSGEACLMSEKSLGYTCSRPKPIRTDFPVQRESFERSQEQKPKKENGFRKTKSKAMKIYKDLKKVKQPMSRGGKLTTFLNSLFTATTPKKTKICTRKSFDETITHNNPKSNSSCTSTCSSASSFSRSCLVKSSSVDKTSDIAKRSVRFYPVSFILGEDNNSYPQVKCGMRNTTSEEVIKLRKLEKNYRNVENEMRRTEKNFHDMDFEDDDAASYASSDLFELDHLTAMEELPVYETTRLPKNLAFANGLIS